MFFDKEIQFLKAARNLIISWSTYLVQLVYFSYSYWRNMQKLVLSTDRFLVSCFISYVDSLHLFVPGPTLSLSFYPYLFLPWWLTLFNSFIGRKHFSSFSLCKAKGGSFFRLSSDKLSSLRWFVCPCSRMNSPSWTRWCSTPDKAVAILCTMTLVLSPDICYYFFGRGNCCLTGFLNVDMPHWRLSPSLIG